VHEWWERQQDPIPAGERDDIDPAAKGNGSARRSRKASARRVLGTATAWTDGRVTGCRMRGWRAVHVVMEAAGLDGPHPRPRAQGAAARLRRRRRLGWHPPNLGQKLGHAQLSTTVIYADAVGEEEQSIAARMW
jgi:hypothetical protein